MKISFLLFPLALLLVGCSTTTTPLTPSNVQTAETQKSQTSLGGYISLNRIAPAVSSPASLLGFMPNPAGSDESTPWLKINTEAGTIQLMNGGQVVEETKIEGKLPIQPGSYTVKHKQRSPLWYAGDDYFLSRGLSIPEAGDKERYRRGALGDFALFVDNDASIHSAPVWTPEVGGLRIDDEKMKKIYYSMDVGATVTVQ